MQQISTTIYYNKKDGYIITSDTTIKNTLLHTVVYPVKTIETECTVEELGQAILQGLDISEKAEPVERNQALSYKFWQISGIKGFSAFSKKYRCVEIIKKDNAFLVAECIRDDDGSYIDAETSENKLSLPLNISSFDIAKLVMELFSTGFYYNKAMETSFTTINNSRISFIPPSENFVDVGDGHTDAYKLFIYGKDTKSYIGFFIDNGYLSYTNEDIKKKWVSLYGELLDYKYDFNNDICPEICVMAHTKDKEIKSLFFKENGGYVELLVEIDISETNASDQQYIREQFDKIVNSIEIK